LSAVGLVPATQQRVAHPLSAVPHPTEIAAILVPGDHRFRLAVVFQGISRILMKTLLFGRVAYGPAANAPSEHFQHSGTPTSTVPLPDTRADD
jgi:hypothetical protein